MIYLSVSHDVKHWLTSIHDSLIFMITRLPKFFIVLFVFFTSVCTLKAFMPCQGNIKIYCHLIGFRDGTKRTAWGEWVRERERTRHNLPKKKLHKHFRKEGKKSIGCQWEGNLLSVCEQNRGCLTRLLWREFLFSLTRWIFFLSSCMSCFYAWQRWTKKVGWKIQPNDGLPLKLTRLNREESFKNPWYTQSDNKLSWTHREALFHQIYSFVDVYSDVVI